MSGIYKVAYTNKNNIQKIYIFLGERLFDLKDVDINELHRIEPENDIFQGIFSLDEQSYIEQYSPEIIFVNESIYYDDTIETIKKKIIKRASDKAISYSGIYLFTKSNEELDASSVYQQLSQDGKIDITRQRLVEFLLNIDDADIDNIEIKEIYDYDDILGLNLEEISPRLLNKPIGQKFVAIEKSFPYTVNPFDAIEYDMFLQKYSSDILATTNQNLLMEVNDIYNNMIFMCLAEDVLEFAVENNLSQETTINIYFPYLKEENVVSLEMYQEAMPRLIVETNNLVQDEAWERNTENINLFNYIYNGKNDKTVILEEGIKQVSFLINPDFSYNLPLDVVFKLINADESKPLIKYNPGKRQEKIYRLYTNKVSNNGKKIPYLSKATIIKKIKQIGKGKQVSIYMEDNIEAGEYSIIMDFTSDGVIEITCSFPIALPIDNINELIRLKCNGIIRKISDFLSQRGYVMRAFDNIYQSNISVEDMEYIIRVPMKKRIAFNKISKCLSSVFNVISDNINEGAVLRFKRVANYNEMDSMEAYIVEKLNRGARDIELITGLTENFKIKDIEEAREKLADFISRQQIVQTAFKGRRAKIKNNPGFETLMIKEALTANLVISIKNINSIHYLETIPKYLTSLLIITQNPSDTSIPLKYIKSLCKKGVVQQEQIKEDVIAKAEEPENKVQELVFGKKEKYDEGDGDAMMDMLIGFSDDESDDESDEESDDEGGNIELNDNAGIDTPLEDGEEITKDITGMSLHPNPIQARIQKRQPSLILTEDKPGMKAYSRACPSNLRRQPIILTQEEKDKIDADHPGSYENALEYKASDDDPSYYYICPRYWSLKDNVSLTEEEVKSGKYGKVIPKRAKEVGEGETIYEMDSSYHRNDKGERINLAPGFYNKKVPGSNMCVPCCYKDWNKPSQVRLRKECLTNSNAPGETKQDPGVKNKTKRKTKKVALDEYVKGPEKFPLENGRLGYLPLTIQRFLKTDNKKCQISKMNTGIRKNTPCLVRIGVEYNEKQSFIAAISSIYVDTIKSSKVPTIAEMKSIILEALSLDLYIQLHNGNLVDIFDVGGEIDINKYTSSKTYKNLNKTNPEEINLFKKLIRSYENYRNYIMNDTIEIDYQYLWDLICMPNTSLFKQGLNLVILDIRNEDITDNVHVLCPTNHYASAFFNVNKRTAIIIKNSGLYEPIIMYEDKGNKYIITKRFSLKYKDMLPNLRETLELIKTSMNSKCIPLPSMPKKYNFARNIPLENILHLLKLKKYAIETQLLNYSGKTIGVIARKKEASGMIPCYPSPPNKSASGYSWMDSYQGIDYQSTKAFLEKVSIDTRKKILSLPALKVIDNGLIVGIITQTNQFVPIFPPTQDTYGDDLNIISDLDYSETNKLSLTNNEIDEEREKYVRKIKLETGFFNAFRNTIRIMLGKYNHRRLRKTIENLVNDNTVTYVEKLREVDKKIRGLVENKVTFTEYSAEALSSISNIGGCMTENNCSTKNYCVTSDGECRLLIPNRNLITDIENEKMYFGRVADEIVRYSRIRAFIFEPKAFLSFSDIKYNLKDDEVILLQSLLLEGYFDDLVPRQENEYVQYNTYDTAVPSESQTYNDIIVNEKRKINVNTKCEKPSIAKVAGKWGRAFPSDSNELIFGNNPELCTFNIIATIVEIHNKTTNDAPLSISEIKEILVDDYGLLFQEHRDVIIRLLKIEGKNIISKRLEMDSITISNQVMSDDYYVTLLDIWIIATRLNIPIVFYSGTKLPETKTILMVANKSEQGNYYFIKIPGARPGVIPKFRLLISGGKATVNIQEVNTEVREMLSNIEDGNLLETFLSNYKMPRKRLKVVSNLKAKSKKPKKLKKKLVLRK